MTVFAAWGWAVNDPTVMFDASYFEHAPCGLVVMEADGTLLRCNATFGNWLGMT